MDLETFDPFQWASNSVEDDDDEEEFTEEEIANDPNKRILWASENNKLDIVTELLKNNPELVFVSDSDGYTPLHRCSYNNHPDVAKLLISHQANVHAKTVDGWQPLHSAARWNSVETAQLLIHFGADVNAQSNGGLTPLHMAASETDNGLMLELLLNNPFIDTTIVSRGGETAKQICERASPHSHLFELRDESVNNLNKVLS